MKRPSKAVVFAVACILLAMPMSGCFDDPEEEEEDPWENYVKFYSIDMNGTKAWTIWFPVGVEPENGTEWFWDDAVVVISDPEGNEPITIVPRFGNEETEEGTFAYYKLLPFPINRTSPYNITYGDSFIVTGVTSEYLNGRIELKIGDDVIQSMSIPKELEEDVEMKLDLDHLSYNAWNSSISWNLYLMPNITKPSTFPMFWDTLRAGIIGPDGTYLVAPKPFSLRNDNDTYEDLKEGMEVDFRFYDHRYSDIWSMSYRIITPEYYWQYNCISDEGDEVMIMGLTEAHVGGRVVIYKGIDKIAESAPIGPFNVPNGTMALGAPTMWSQISNASMLFNASFPVLDVGNNTTAIPWNSTSVVVRDGSSNVLVDQLIMVEGDPGNFCSSFEVMFVDSLPKDGNISKGDRLVLKGIDLGFRGATMELEYNDNVIGRSKFPDRFDLTGVELATDLRLPRERTVGNGTVFDLRVSVYSRIPYRVTMPWEQIEVRVVDRMTDTVLIGLTRPEQYNDTLPDEPGILMKVYEDDNSTEDWSATIYISALNRTFEDTYLELFLGDDMVGSEWLEGPFNISFMPVVLNLASPSIDAIDINSTDYYKVILNINKITPKYARAYWNNITIRILAANGSLLVSEQRVVSDTQVYDTDDTDGIDVELWYVETSWGDNKASAGDAFKLTGLTTDFEEAVVQVFYIEELIGSATLASDFQ